MRKNWLSETDLAPYAERGYLHFESAVPDETLVELQTAAAEFVEASRSMEESGKILDLEPGHSPEAPRIRRLNSPVDRHPAFYSFAIEGFAAQLACRLLGGPVRFHHSKLNFKWSHGGVEIRWHQDIQFWPHTDFSPLTIGVYLEDVTDSMGPMGVLPGSQLGPLYDQYLPDGSWAGAISDTNVEELNLKDIVWLTGPAGSVTVHNCCMVHGSLPNDSDSGRPLLLQTYSRADSYPIAHIGANGVTGPTSGTIIGGSSSQALSIEGRKFVGAPDWSRAGAPTTSAFFGSRQKGN